MQDLKNKMDSAYWINPRGKVLDIGMGTHIDQIIKSPKAFGLTDKYINDLYSKFNEPVSLEGKAREQIMQEVIKDGFIRIRLLKNQFWIVNADKWTKKVKKALSVWAGEAKTVRGAGKFMPVKIVTNHETVSKYDVNDLYYEKHLNESEKNIIGYNPMIVESIDDFKYSEYTNLMELIKDQTND